MKLAKYRKDLMPSATRGILAMADAGGINAEMIRSITSLFKSSPQKIRRLILDKLLQMKDGGEVYEGLLKDSRKENAKRGSIRFYTDSSSGLRQWKDGRSAKDLAKIWFPNLKIGISIRFGNIFRFTYFYLDISYGTK
jgi:hypothetical protein